VNEYFTPAIVPADPEANTTDLLLARLAATPDAPLFALPTADGGWSDVSVAEFHRQVVALAKGLVAAGIAPGEKIGFICKTRYEWTLVDFAAWFAGAVLVPIYETSAPAQIQFNLTDSGATALIVETAEHFARFDEIRSELPQVTKVWQLGLGDLDKLVAGGTGVSDDEIEKRRSAAKGSDLATLIYTSGSTGQPKGCIISHSNFVELSRNAAVAMGEVVAPGSSTLLFITTAHVFARFISMVCRLKMPRFRMTRRSVTTSSVVARRIAAGSQLAKASTPKTAAAISRPAWYSRPESNAVAAQPTATARNATAGR